MIEGGAWIESWHAPPRFALYLAHAGGDRLRALRLYEWNAAVSAAFQHDLSHLEVGLRYLHKAFRPGVGRRVVDEPIKRLHRLRNRVAHHEPLLEIDLFARSDDVLTLAGLILPELRSHIATTSACSKLLAQRP